MLCRNKLQKMLSWRLCCLLLFFFVSRIFSSVCHPFIELWGYTDYLLLFDYIKLSFWLSKNAHKLVDIEMSQFVTVCLKQFCAKMKRVSRGREIGHMLHAWVIYIFWDAGRLTVVTGVTFQCVFYIRGPATVYITSKVQRVHKWNWIYSVLSNTNCSVNVFTCRWLFVPVCRWTGRPVQDVLPFAPSVSWDWLQLPAIPAQE